MMHWLSLGQLAKLVKISTRRDRGLIHIKRTVDLDLNRMLI
jgi:hypothetical protein